MRLKHLILLTFAYCLFRGLPAIFHSVDLRQPFPEVITYYMFAQDAGQALVWLFAAALILMLRLKAQWIDWIMAVLVIASFGCVVYTQLADVGQPRWLVYNGAQHAILVMPFIPILAKRWAGSLLPALIPCYFFHQWVAYAMLAAFVFAGLLRAREWFVLTLVTLAAAFAVVYTAHTSQLEHFTDRWEHWSFAWGHIWEHPWLGWGAGKWFHGFPELQVMASGFHQDVWTMAHNDYLQLFFEYGLVGVALASVCLFRILGRAWKRGYYWIAAWAYLTGAFFHFPLHDMATALAGLLIIKHMESTIGLNERVFT